MHLDLKQQANQVAGLAPLLLNKYSHISVPKQGLESPYRHEPTVTDHHDLFTGCFA